MAEGPGCGDRTGGDGDGIGGREAGERTDPLPVEEQCRRPLALSALCCLYLGAAESDFIPRFHSANRAPTAPNAPTASGVHVWALLAQSSGLRWGDGACRRRMGAEQANGLPARLGKREAPRPDQCLPVGLQSLIPLAALVRRRLANRSRLVRRMLLPVLAGLEVWKGGAGRRVCHAHARHSRSLNRN